MRARWPRRAARIALRALYRTAVPSGLKNRLAMERLLMEELRPPQLVECPAGERVLVLAPHMDDEAIGCGGTLAKHVQRGARVTVTFLTDGSRGDPILEARERDLVRLAEGRRTLVGIRKEEAQAVADLLGLAEVRFLDFPDSELAPTSETVGVVGDLMASVRPEVVYTPFLGDRLADHLATNAILVEVLRGRSDGPQICAYEVWSPLYANLMVDITPLVEKKRRALEQYQSQLRYINLVHTSLGLNAHRSMFHLQGQGYAEAFFTASSRQYCWLFDHLRL